MAQALSFVSDLKIGHYMKIPPRSLFWAQTIATILGAIINCATVLWQLNTFEKICEPDQPQHFTCAGSATFFTASIIWGAIGPARIFGPGQIYNGALWGFLIGAFLPIPGWFLAKKYPLSWYKYINWPIIIGGTGNTPPATGVNYTVWGILGFIFQYIIRRRYFSWWAKYNYILSAALDTGTAFALFIGFFALAYSDNAPNLTWLGNDNSGDPGTMYGNLDANGNTANLVLGENQTHFGVDTWA
jgi:OPT family oligopeptide transporter